VGDEDAVVVQSASGVILAATPQAEDILGLSREQLLGRASADPRWAAVDTEGNALRGRDHPAMRAVATGRDVRGAEIGVHRPGRDRAGDHVWLTVDAVPLPRRDGTDPAVVVRFSLVAGQRAADLRHAAAERLHRLMVDHGPDIAAWQLPDSTFLWVSAAAETILGHSPEEMVGKTCADFVHPEDVPRFESAREVIMAGSEPDGPVVLRMRHADGSYRDLEAIGHVLCDADGRAAQVRTAWRDVTQRVAAERERDAALALVQSVLNESPIGTAICDAEGTIEQVNPAMCAVLACTPEDLRGRTLDEFRFAGCCEAGVAEAECRFRRADGSVIWGLISTVTLPGASARVMVHLQDVTGRRSTQEQLLYSATHDPLTGLANRAAFDTHLEQTHDHLAADESSGLLFIDLDDFKSVNDTYGHDVGDDLLRQVAARITGSIRDDDFAARLGGDEFVVHCPRVHDMTVAVIADRLERVLSRPYLLATATVQVTASVGSATASGPSRAALVAAADRAMYEVKRSRRAAHPAR
jgi:diguanylate cyclase (GGDEF)-like protein/PAS domain S-box-containing protein